MVRGRLEFTGIICFKKDFVGQYKMVRVVNAHQDIVSTVSIVYRKKTFAWVAINRYKPKRLVKP